MFSKDDAISARRPVSTAIAGGAEQRLGWGLIVVSIPLLWLAADQVSLLFSVAPYVSACYPANGLIVGFFLVFGCRFKPYVIAIVITHIIYWQMGQFSTTFDLIQGIRHQVVYGCMAIILVNYFNIGVPATKTRDVSLFVAGSILSTLLSALIAAYSFYAYHLAGNGQLLPLIASFWIGDLTGLIVFCPIIIQLFLLMRRNIFENKPVLILPHPTKDLIASMLISTAILVLVKILPDMLELKENALLLMVVPITFVALQGGLLPAITITAYVNILIGFSNHFFSSPLGANDLEMFMLTTGITGLFIGILSEEGRRGERSLWKLARQNHLLAAAAQASPTPMSVVDIDHPDMPVRLVNQAFERMTGFGSNRVVGTPLQKSLSADDAVINRLRRQFAERQEFSLRQISRTSRASDFVQIIHFAPVYDENECCVAYVGLHDDITEKMFRDAAEREREKLVSLGNMAGGIAHELNNILHPILNFTKMSRQIQRSNPDEADRYLEIVQRSAIKAGEIVHKVLAYVRRDLEQPTPTVFSGALQEALELVRTRVPPGITICDDTSLGNERVIIGRTELTQIVMNLVLNAIHAMGDHGQLRIVGGIEDLPEPLVGKVMLAPGRYVRLAVSDTGPGIPADVQDRIFEPFFTTKPAGEGAGLGLAVVQSILSSVSGGIAVDSAPGEGATFIVYLPVTQKHTAQAGQGGSL